MPVVDLSVLAAQTGGDVALEREVLKLFADRVAADLALLAQAGGAARAEIAHRIVGSARAVGANDVARCAGAVERDTGEMEALVKAIAEARDFIARHLQME